MFATIDLSGYIIAGRIQSYLYKKILLTLLHFHMFSEWVRNGRDTAGMPRSVRLWCYPWKTAATVNVTCGSMASILETTDAGE